MHTARDAAAPDFPAPDQPAAIVRIERIDVTGLLARDEQIASTRQCRENRGRADVEVGAVLGRAVGAATDEAGHVPGVVRDALVVPGELAGVEVEGEHEVPLVGAAGEV